MKGLHLSLCLLLPLVSGNAFAATPDSPAVPEAAAPSPAATELERLSKSWMDAMLAHDKPQLETLMAPDFILHAPGRAYPDTPRARWLDNLFNHLEIRQWEQTDITAHVYGTIGVVTSTYRWAGTMFEHTFDVGGYCTDVWRSVDAGWQVASRTCMEFPDATVESPESP